MIIVYSSTTGHTKQYSEMLAEELKISAYSIDQVPVNLSDEDVIYLGWLLAGGIKGLSKVRSKYNVRCVIATGMTAESPEQEEFVRRKSQLPVSVGFFYLQAGYDFNKLQGIYKLMMKIKTKEILARYDGKSQAEKEADATYRMVTEGYSVISPEHLTRVVEWIQNNL